MDRPRKKRQVSDKEATAGNKEVDRIDGENGRLDGERPLRGSGGRMTRTNSSRTIKTNDPVASTSSSPGLSLDQD